MRSASSATSARRILDRLDARLAGIELVKWPALEQSLRAEIADATAIARAMGFDVAPSACRVQKTGQNSRNATCHGCGLTVARNGTRVVQREGRRRVVCARCSKHQPEENACPA
jgi:hypothetical protein